MDINIPQYISDILKIIHEESKDKSSWEQNSSYSSLIPIHKEEEGDN